MTQTKSNYDVVIVGAGLSGMVAAHEAVERGRTVMLIDQEGEQSLGGQAFWSLGGLFMINTPEQRRLGIKDSRDLAAQDWFGSAQFDRPEDENPRKFAEAYLDFAAGEMRSWLHDVGMRWFPVVGWAERGGASANGHGNSVPRFHVTWGTGTGVVAPFERLVRTAHQAGKLTFGFRHRVAELITTDGAVTGIRGDILAPDGAVRGASTNRDVVDQFEISAQSVIITSGGIGGNHDMVRAA